MNKYTPFRMRNSFSFLIDRKSLNINIVFFVLLLGSAIVVIGLGEQFISPLKVVAVLFGNGDPFSTLIVNSFRLPRIIIAMLVGICLAIAGAILQGVVKNPIASPDIIGITGGAAAAVVLFLNLFSTNSGTLTVSIEWLPLAAFTGACIISILLYLFAWQGGVSPVRMVLVGIGMWAFTKAATTLLLIMGPIHQQSQANIWITGSVYGASWEGVRILFPITLILFFVTIVMIRMINIQEFGEDVATSVGNRVQLSRFFLLLVSTALTGSAVAFGGGISFVGLLAPHIARRLVGSSFGALLPLSAFIGAILVLISDTIGRVVFLPLEIPAGVFTAAVGAPYFIFLLYKQRNVG
ncbi:iron ABC transporter permease [Priestia filamentosa]|uniref:FecCD family ABC transporter permease n=1 Tax=Priestia filamentosa TaxID=1402861 RepID=UPI002E1E36C4|nr:iron ABC transporter permease [Priestia filamentosa]